MFDKKVETKTFPTGYNSFHTRHLCPMLIIIDHRKKKKTTRLQKRNQCTVYLYPTLSVITFNLTSVEQEVLVLWWRVRTKVTCYATVRESSSVYLQFTLSCRFAPTSESTSESRSRDWHRYTPLSLRITSFKTSRLPSASRPTSSSYRWTRGTTHSLRYNSV